MEAATRAKDETGSNLWIEIVANEKARKADPDKVDVQAMEHAQKADHPSHQGWSVLTYRMSAAQVSIASRDEAGSLQGLSTR